MICKTQFLNRANSSDLSRSFDYVPSAFESPTNYACNATKEYQFVGFGPPKMYVHLGINNNQQIWKNKLQLQNEIMSGYTEDQMTPYFSRHTSNFAKESLYVKPGMSNYIKEQMTSYTNNSRYINANKDQMNVYQKGELTNYPKNQTYDCVIDQMYDSTKSLVYNPTKDQTYPDQEARYIQKQISNKLDYVNMDHSNYQDTMTNNSILMNSCTYQDVSTSASYQTPVSCSGVVKSIKNNIHDGPPRLNLPCQTIDNWNYNECYEYYADDCYNTCQFVNFVDIEDFM